MSVGQPKVDLAVFGLTITSPKVLFLRQFRSLRQFTEIGLGFATDMLLTEEISTSL
jgi:hypothetical protein